MKLTIPPIPSDPADLHPSDGTRFADIPVSFLLLARYASEPEMIMTWLVRAMAEREDAGLGLPPREPYMLAATAGISLDKLGSCTEQLISEGFLTRWPDKSIRVPWGRIYEASVEAALQLRLRVDALRGTQTAHTNTTASPTTTPVQASLDLA